MKSLDDAQSVSLDLTIKIVEILGVFAVVCAVVGFFRHPGEGDAEGA